MTNTARQQPIFNIGDLVTINKEREYEYYDNIYMVIDAGKNPANPRSFITIKKVIYSGWDEQPTKYVSRFCQRDTLITPKKIARNRVRYARELHDEINIRPFLNNINANLQNIRFRDFNTRTPQREYTPQEMAQNLREIDEICNNIRLSQLNP